MLKSLYQNTYSAVWCKDGLTDCFRIDVVLKQKCPASPTVFSFFINDLVKFIGKGVKAGQLKINALMYADDVLIMADNINVLQKMIVNLQTHCIRWNLTLNISDSKIVVFMKGGRWLSEKIGSMGEKHWL